MSSRGRDKCELAGEGTSMSWSRQGQMWARAETSVSWLGRGTKINWSGQGQEWAGQFGHDENGKWNVPERTEICLTPDFTVDVQMFLLYARNIDGLDWKKKELQKPDCKFMKPVWTRFDKWCVLLLCLLKYEWTVTACCVLSVWSGSVGVQWTDNCCGM